MCDNPTPRFLSFYYQVTLSDDDALPLEIWLEDNIPEDYRVASIMADKIVTHDVVINYHIVVEHKI